MRPQGRPRSLTPEEVTQLRQGWTDGRRVIDMAFEFGVSSTTLNRVIQEQKFPPRPRPRSVPMSREKRVAVPTIFRVPVLTKWYEGGNQP